MIISYRRDFFINYYKTLESASFRPQTFLKFKNLRPRHTIDTLNYPPHKHNKNTDVYYYFFNNHYVSKISEFKKKKSSAKVKI